MSDEQTQDQNVDSQQHADGSGEQPEAKGDLFTQADVDRIVKSRAERVSKQAVSGLLESLGVQNVDDLKGVITAQKEAEEAQKSELERLTERATKAQSDAEKLQARLAQEQQDRLIERTAVKMGFFDVTDAVALADRGEFGEDLTGETVENSLKALLETKPHLAGQTQETPKPSAPDIKANNGNAASQSPDIIEAGKRYLPAALKRS